MNELKIIPIKNIREFKRNLVDLSGRGDENKCARSAMNAIRHGVKQIKRDKFTSEDDVFNNILIEYKTNCAMDRKGKNAATAVGQGVSELHLFFFDSDGTGFDFDIDYFLIVDSFHAMIFTIDELAEFYMNDKKYVFNKNHCDPDKKLVRDIKNSDVFKKKYVHDLRNDIDLLNFAMELEDIFLKTPVKRKRKITRKNFVRLYLMWRENLKIDDEKIDDQLAACLFLQDMMNEAELVEEKRKLLFIDDDKISNKFDLDNVEQYKEFWKRFYRPVDQEEYRHIIFNKDKLIKMKIRWKEGEFFTPMEIVEKSYEMFFEHYNIDELDLKQYSIWDPCSGRGNLLWGCSGPTYENCFLSTLNQEDVDAMIRDDYYPGATIFQYNWLNQNDDELPEELLNALKDPIRKWLFIMNPPWGSNCGCTHNLRSEDKKNIDNLVNEQMKQEGLSKFSNELMYQSFYRLIKLIKKYNLNAKIMFICNWNIIYSTNGTFREFLNKNNVFLVNGFLFSGNVHFKTGNVPIAFSLLFDNSKQQNIVDLEIFYDKKIGVMKYNYLHSDFNIRSTIKSKNKGYLLNKVGLQINKEIKVPELYDFYIAINMTSDFDLYSSKSQYAGENGCFINKTNMNNIVYNSIVSKFVLKDWYNRYTQRIFNTNEYDSDIILNHLIYLSLHQTYGRTTSLSQTFEGELISIRNPFFYLSKSEFLSIPGLNKKIYEDCKISQDSWFIKYLNENKNKLCKPATELLEIVKEITKKTIENRIHEINVRFKKDGDLFNTQLDSRWDAGWYQISHGILNNSNFQLDKSILELYEKYKIKIKELEEYLKQKAKELKLTDDVIIYEEKESSNFSEDIYTCTSVIEDDD